MKSENLFAGWLALSRAFPSGAWRVTFPHCGRRVWIHRATPAEAAEAALRYRRSVRCVAAITG